MEEKKEKQKEKHLVGYKIMRCILKPIFKFYYKPHIENKEVIPKEGPIIFCGNHLHLFDSGVVCISTKRMVHYLAKIELFQDKKFGWFYKMSGCIPVDRSVHDGVAKNEGINILNDGYAIGLYPEGTRNKTDEFLLPFKFGAVSMAQKTGAKIIPFGMSGKFKFRYGVNVKFGDPFEVPSDMSLEEANKILYDRIYTLKEECMGYATKKDEYQKKALVTGAGSGMGREMARYLSSLGYQLFLVDINEDNVNETVKMCHKAKAMIYDLSKLDSAKEIYDSLKNENIDLLVNNAGLGFFGEFNSIDLKKDMNVINVNMISVHTLTKLFLQDMVKRNSGHILNVASLAGFMAGPYFSTYFACKNYVLKLTMAINEELRKSKSNVSVSAFCPGSVATKFNVKAGGKFNAKTSSPEKVAKYAIDKTLKNKMIIIPTFKARFEVFITRFVPTRLLLNHVYKRYKKKSEEK